MTPQPITLITYDHWANDKIHKSMLQAKVLPDRTLELFCHILAVSSIWLSRAKGEPENTKRFDLYTLQECATRNDQMLTDWLEYINNTPGLEEKVMTFTLLGQPSSMSVMDCINHVAIHGSYHRGQIVNLLKGQVEQLPMTDYVLFALDEKNKN